jgi:hypothetical protein
MELLRNFSDLPADPAWAFDSGRSTNGLTHGYHRYPAKFPPQIVSKLLETYAKSGDLIVDVFAGCGTTLVESKAHGYKSVGVDINPVAKMITEAKTSPLRPTTVVKAWQKLNAKIDAYAPELVRPRPLHDRINYWFEPDVRIKLAYLYQEIDEIRNAKVQTFFLCALSNILKNVSRWLQTSTKPQIDPTKQIGDPFIEFRFQVKKMIARNDQFYQKLKESNTLGLRCEIKLADARKTRMWGGQAGMVISSPPYVTSYEYADIHQLTGYWFEYISDLPNFRKRFIGTFYSGNEKLTTKTPSAQSAVLQLQEQCNRTAREVASYFNDMFRVTIEMKRLLRKDGVASIVLGNTKLKGVKIHCAEAFAEMLEMNGFEVVDTIKREITTKILPTIRDKETGKFTTTDSTNSQKVYPEEYIIIARKK